PVTRRSTGDTSPSIAGSAPVPPPPIPVGLVMGRSYPPARRPERVITFLHAKAHNNSQNGGNFAPPTYAEYAYRREHRHSPTGGAGQSCGEETAASCCGGCACSELVSRWAAPRFAT